MVDFSAQNLFTDHLTSHLGVNNIELSKNVGVSEILSLKSDSW